MSHYQQEDSMPRGDYDRLEADRDRLKLENHRMSQRLTAFLYLLIRDHLPFGVVMGLINSQLPPEMVEFNFTNTPANALAHLMAGRLRGNL